MKKRLLSVIMSVAMLATMLTGCGSSADDTYKVGVAIYNYDDNFMTLYRNEIESYFAALGEQNGKTYELSMVDGKNDMATQTNQIDTFITQGMDVIILNCVQTSSADVLIDKIVAADIPLVLINREPLAYDADGNTMDEAYAYHIGASVKDAGKKCFGVNLIEDSRMVRDIVERLKLESEEWMREKNI